MVTDSTKFFTLFVLFILHASLGQTLDLYVGKYGDDTFEGSITEPFLTIQRAQEVVREVKDSHDGPITVHIRGGRYAIDYVDGPLLFTPEDSGVDASRRITYQAYRSSESSTGTDQACLDRCEEGCLARWDVPIYTDEFHAHFLHLFEHDIRAEEECRYICMMTCCPECEEVIISGGVELEPVWEAYTDIPGVYVTNVSSGLWFDELLLDDARLPRARYPNLDTEDRYANGNGYLTGHALDGLFMAPPRQPMGDEPGLPVGAQTLRVGADVLEPARVEAWRLELSQRRSVAELYIYPRGLATDGNLLFEIRDIDVAEAGADGDVGLHNFTLGAGGDQIDTAYFRGQFPPLPPTATASAAPRFRVDNMFAELDAPGEWYLDSSTSQLYVFSLASEGGPPTGAFVAPMTTELLKLQGRAGVMDWQAHTPPPHDVEQQLVPLQAGAQGGGGWGEPSDSNGTVSHLTFDHLIFSDTATSHYFTFEVPAGSTWGTAFRGGAVWMEATSDVTLRGCRVLNAGGNGIYLSGLHSNLTVTECEVGGAGGHALVASGHNTHLTNHTAARWDAHTAARMRSYVTLNGALLANNLLHDFGRCTEHAVGLWLAVTRAVTLKNNVIYHFPPGASPEVVDTAQRLSDEQPLLRPTAGMGAPPLTALLLDADHVFTVNGTGFTTPVTVRVLSAPPSAALRAGPPAAAAAAADSSEQQQPPLSVFLLSELARTAHRGLSARPDTLWDANGTVLRPGESLQILLHSAPTFQTPLAVELGYYKATTGGITRIESLNDVWVLTTRPCSFRYHEYTAQCAGPCDCMWSGPHCPAEQGYHRVDNTRVCAGPFDGWGTCTGRGGAEGSPGYVRFLDCNATCLREWCD